MGIGHTSYVAKSVTLASIAVEVAKIDPCDPLYKRCVFCNRVIGFNAPVEAHEERFCAWRHAKEFVAGDHREG